MFHWSSWLGFWKNLWYKFYASKSILDQKKKIKSINSSNHLNHTSAQGNVSLRKSTIHSTFRPCCHFFCGLWYSLMYSDSGFFLHTFTKYSINTCYKNNTCCRISQKISTLKIKLKKYWRVQMQINGGLLLWTKTISCRKFFYPNVNKKTYFSVFQVVAGIQQEWYLFCINTIYIMIKKMGKL